MELLQAIKIVVTLNIKNFKMAERDDFKLANNSIFFPFHWKLGLPIATV